MVMMRPLEFLGPEQRVSEVDEQRGGDDAGESIVEDHGCLLEPVAGVHVGDRRREEAEADSDQDKVQHFELLLAEQ